MYVCMYIYIYIHIHGHRPVVQDPFYNSTTRCRDAMLGCEGWLDEFYQPSLCLLVDGILAGFSELYFHKL